jgi:hypothetical protein
MTSILKGLWVWFQMEAFRLGGDLHWLKPSCTYPLLPFEVTSSLSAKILLVSHLAGPQRSKGLTWLPQHSHSHSLNTAEFPVPILRFPVPSKTRSHSLNSGCLPVHCFYHILNYCGATEHVETSHTAVLPNRHHDEAQHGVHAGQGRTRRSGCAVHRSRDDARHAGPGLGVEDQARTTGGYAGLSDRLLLRMLAGL